MPAGYIISKAVYLDYNPKSNNEFGILMRRCNFSFAYKYLLEYFFIYLDVVESQYQWKILSTQFDLICWLVHPCLLWDIWPTYVNIYAGLTSRESILTRS